MLTPATLIWLALIATLNAPLTDMEPGPYETQFQLRIPCHFVYLSCHYSLPGSYQQHTTLTVTGWRSVDEDQTLTSLFGPLPLLTNGGSVSVGGQGRASQLVGTDGGGAERSSGGGAVGEAVWWWLRQLRAKWEELCVHENKKSVFVFGSMAEPQEQASRDRVQRRKPKRFTKKHIFSDEKIHGKCPLLGQLEFRDTFHMFDKNGDGMITTEELGQVMMSLGQRPTLDELKSFIRAVDTDRSGTIDFDEFVDIFARKVTMDPEAELKEVFRAFDSDHDGFISPSELFNVLVKLGEKITRKEAEEMVKEADLNGDGKVDYAEFKAILTSK
ncbi:hypothetical protein BaRGS_00025685 [Batillaria attramentaria]|uniref:EF-hand domain-containing protein n=1 Tax=Batillaria attramentaria TaxID=370345 RepID=A0ABD0K6H1_9CAEN